MNKTAVQFGAGNIGRGFIGQLFYESGYNVVFVDVVPEVVAALNARREYVIHIVGKGAQEVPITYVRAVDGHDRDSVAAEIAACDIACTAVGAGALKYIAPNLASGLLLRHNQDGGPLTVLICENLHDAKDVLRSLVADCLPDDERDAVLAKTGFVQAVVSRMVPLQISIQNHKSKIQNLDICVEAYKRLPVDGSSIVGEMPSIVGVEPVPNFTAHVERKLYTHNCAHATLGYLGYRQSITYGYEALVNPDIRNTLDQVMQETGAALVRKHGFDPQEHTAHVADLLERFQNRELGDTCFRLARDPLRKLAPDDRLVGAARLCESQGVKPAALAWVIAQALRFDAPEDPSAVEMQRRIRETGVGTFLRDTCGVRDDERLGRLIVFALRAAELR